MKRSSMGPALRAAAEQCAVDRMSIEQAASDDPRPIDPAVLEQQVRRQRAQWGCRAAFDAGELRWLTERNLRIARRRMRSSPISLTPNPA